ncbi:hypothetical protein DEH69_22565 [Streptomyces sp. PT12]|nr:hypothetical protein DEH69_22565 [Streptomyces sp. PT12]
MGRTRARPNAPGEDRTGAAASRKAMSADLRARFDSGMRDLAADPYDCERDRRDATVAGVAVRYYVSRSVVTVTVVRLVFY